MRGSLLGSQLSKLQIRRCARDDKPKSVPMWCNSDFEAMIHLPTASLAHLSREVRNGEAVLGASISPCKDVLKGTMRP